MTVTGTKEIMREEKIRKFFELLPNGIYIRTLTPQGRHGFFTNVDTFIDALKVIPKDQPLYFNAHELTDIDFVPVNCFEPIQRGQGIKTENIRRLRYGILDFDPIHNTEVVNGEIVKRNLTKEENQQIVKEVDAVRMELLRDGFDNIGLINSGNGAYLVFPFSAVKDPCENIKVFKRFAEILKKRYRLNTAQIDTKTIKVSQLFKLPGSLSAKGTSTKDNPFRYAEIVEEWNSKKSCWKAIKAYVENNAVDDLVFYSSHGPELDINACMKYCQKHYPVFRGENHDYRVRIDGKGIVRDMDLDSSDFASELRIHLRDVTGILDIDKRAIDDIITFLKDEAYQKEISTLASRVYYDVKCNTVYYDMCNHKDIIEISPTQICKKDKPLGMFDQKITDKEQVEYVPTPAKDLPMLLSKVANVTNNNLLILATFLCVCFLGNCFPTAALLITGPQGTSKSTLTRFVQRIVHPQKVSLLSLSAKIQDISIALSTRLLTCFDNASSVKADVADILCSAVTKGCFQTRKLYTTSDESLIVFKSIIVINGIDIISRRTDLMERCLLLELEPILPEKRKTEREVERDFEDALPKILGAIFDAIQQALAMEDVELKTLSRMADFEQWAVKFAISMGYSAEDYQEALKANKQNLIDAVSFGNPIIFAVVELMRYKDKAKYVFQEFYAKCYEILKTKATPNELSMFPKSASSLSRALGGMEENLKAFGITFSSENVGPNKEARLTNDGSVIPNAGASDIDGKLVYEAFKKEQK